MRQFLRWAARSGYIVAAPNFEELKLPARKKKARGLRPKEMDIVCEKLEGHDQLQEWFELAIQIGLRPGEQSHLLIRDYDADERLLTVRPSDDEEAGEQPFDDHELKTENSERTLELNDDAHVIMERLLANAGERKLATGAKGEQLLFPNSDGGVYDLDNLRNDFKALLPEGTFFTLYSLRHTFAYGCVAENWNPAKLQLFMGHSSIVTTQNYYKGMTAKQVGAPPSLHKRKAAQG